MEMNVTLSHPSSCLFFLLLLFSDPLSVTGTPIPAMTDMGARVLNRARKAKLAKAFLDAHNIARVSSGVPPLRWDRGLAKFAHKWAHQRKADCQMIHAYGPYGENIFWYKRKKTWTPEKVVNKWVEERVNYDANTNTCAPGTLCGHYTQIVWRDTTAVGCARVKCNNSRGFLVVCEYNPPGNYEGDSPFDQYIG